MSKTITVSISDELYARLGKVSKRFNVSATAACAIETEVQIQELLTGGKGMEATIQRLQAEKDSDDALYSQMGRTDGIKKASKMKYGELIEFKGYRDTIAEVPECDSAPWGMLRNSEWLDDLREEAKDNLEGDAQFNSDKWLIGFINGVGEFYDEVKDKLK